MKKRILSILLLCCMVLTMLPAPAFAADEEAYALPPDTGGLCEHHPEHEGLRLYAADRGCRGDALRPCVRNPRIRRQRR